MRSGGWRKSLTVNDWSHAETGATGVAALALAMVLGLAVAPVRPAALEGGTMQADVQARIVEALDGNPAHYGVTLTDNGQSVTVSVDATDFFDSGSAAIEKTALPLLDRLGPVLATLPYPLCIEGHTDSDPLTPSAEFPDNWALSGARAAGVIRYFHQFHGIPYPRMAMAAYADTRPIAHDAGAAGKARNRRLAIVITAG